MAFDIATLLARALDFPLWIDLLQSFWHMLRFQWRFGVPPSTRFTSVVGQVDPAHVTATGMKARWPGRGDWMRYFRLRVRKMLHFKTAQSAGLRSHGMLSPIVPPLIYSSSNGRWLRLVGRVNIDVRGYSQPRRRVCSRLGGRRDEPSKLREQLNEHPEKRRLPGEPYIVPPCHLNTQEAFYRGNARLSLGFGASRKSARPVFVGSTKALRRGLVLQCNGGCICSASSPDTSTAHILSVPACRPSSSF